MILKDWYADYPDAEDFLYPLLHSASRGAGGNVSFYSNPAFDSVVTARAPRARRAEAQPLYRAGRLDRLRRRADGLPVLLQRALRRAAVDQALPAAGDLQRPALDRRRHRHSHTSHAARTREPLHRPPPAARHPDAVRRARRRVSAALRRAGRSGGVDGRRARRQRDDRAPAPTAAPRRSAPAALRPLRRQRASPATSARRTSPTARSPRTSASVFPRRCSSPARRCSSPRARRIARRAERATTRRVRRRIRARRRVPRHLVPGVLGGTAADSAVRGHAASGCRHRATEACAFSCCPRSRSACDRSRSWRA